MRRLIVFNSVTLDGYFSGPHGDTAWAHSDDPEWTAFADENAKGGGELMFGRLTYDMMKSYWPTPEAKKNQPQMAERMNTLPKVVFSHTVHDSPWPNTTMVDGDPAAEVRKMKNTAGPDMVILGSGSIVSQLAEAGLIDEYQMVLTPIVLGEGRTMFEGVDTRPAMELTGSRTFKNGNVFLRYKPKVTAAA